MKLSPQKRGLVATLALFLLLLAHPSMAACPAEFPNEQRQKVCLFSDICTGDGSLVNCCKTNQECINDAGECVPSGTVDNIAIDGQSFPNHEEVCRDGIWRDGDLSTTTCSNFNNNQIHGKRPTFAITLGSGAFNSCCQDDPWEYFTKCSDQDSSENGDCGPAGGRNACCPKAPPFGGISNPQCLDHNQNCQIEGRCYVFGASGKKSFCGFGKWEDPDESQQFCQAGGCEFKWALGGEKDPTACCGDDLNEEFERICEDSSENGDCDTGTNSNACCDQNTDCVGSDGACKADGACFTFGSAGKKSFCEKGVWEDPDSKRENCESSGCQTASGTQFQFDIGGEVALNKCCGDDANEEARKCESTSASGSCGTAESANACCDLASDCVDQAGQCQPDDQCHTFGSLGKKSYCQGGTWKDPDTSKSLCEDGLNCGLFWNLGGEISPTTCCGDDPGETKQICSSESSSGACGADKIACCSSTNSCVDGSGACQPENECRPLGNLGKASFCKQGVWKDPDDSKASCEAPGCAGEGGLLGQGNYQFAIGGSVGDNKCCGDDLGEHVIQCDDNSANGECGTRNAACCGPKDCVDHLGACKSTGSCQPFGKDNRLSYCNEGTWEDPDQARGFCEADGCTTKNEPFTYGLPGAIGAGPCCGDDLNEEEKTKQCVAGACQSDNNDKACCGLTTDCVSKGGCFTDRTLHDVDSDGDNEICKGGTWEDGDQSEDNCRALDAFPSPTKFLVGATCGKGTCNEVTGNNNEFCCGDDDFELFDPAIFDPTKPGICIESNEKRGTASSDCIKNNLYYQEGEFIGDDYCEKGRFTSRTRLIATTLLDIANRTSPKNFTLFCDSFENALNYVNYPVTDRQVAAQRYLDGRGGFAAVNTCRIQKGDAVIEELPCVNNICVLKYHPTRGPEEATVLGVSLNRAINDKNIDFPFIEVLPGLKDCDAATGSDGKYRRCEASNANVWYNELTKTILYSRDPILNIPDTVEVFFFEKFLTFLRHPLQSIFNYLNTKVILDSKVFRPSDYRFINRASAYSRLYLERSGFQSIKAIAEKIRDTNHESISIAYTGFDQNICQTIGEIDARVRSSDPLSRVLCRAEPKNVTHYVFTNASIGINLWPELTAQIRIQDLGCGTNSIPTIPSLFVPPTALVGKPTKLSAEVEVCKTPYKFRWDIGGAAAEGSSSSAVLEYEATFSSPGKKTATLTLREDDGTGKVATATKDFFVSTSGECEVKDNCDSATQNCIFSLSSVDDAHAEKSCIGTFTKKVCCNNLYRPDPANCVQGLLKLSATEDAHADWYEAGGSFTEDICITTSFNSPSCSMKQTPCTAEETCIVTLASKTDSHLSSCDSTVTNFANRICCKLKDDTTTGTVCQASETQACGSNKGECIFGTQTCQNGAFGPCIGGTAPIPEVCDDQKDNNCNGQIDEGCQITQECQGTQTKQCVANALGECKLGTQTCQKGAFGTCIPAAATAEVCNDGKDNNCNGQADEGCVTIGGCQPGETRFCSTGQPGECSFGTQACIGGNFGGCVGSSPVTEVCNDQRDNDCDGQTDENCPSADKFDLDGSGIFDSKDVGFMLTVFFAFKQGNGPAIATPLTFDLNNDQQFSSKDVGVILTVFFVRK